MHKSLSHGMRGAVFVLAIVLAAGLQIRLTGPAAAQAAASDGQIPRTADGRPNLQGIWQTNNRAAYGLEDHHARHLMPPGRSVVVGGTIPYQDWAATQRDENFANRYTADPFSKCYFPGVPRIMYLDHPYQIFQARDHIAIGFEWSGVYRVIYTNGSEPNEGIEFWMGDSRGRWDGDTLVVEVTNFNDKTWLDMAGNFHSAALKVTERFTMLDADTIQYEAEIEDPKVFTRPWTIRMPIYRQKDMDRVLEYHCNAEASEQNGSFHRDPKTWYPK